MGVKGKVVSLTNTGGMRDYEISAKERLDSHYFLQWNLKRWRGSAFRKRCDPDVGWFGFNLFCIAQDGTPVGTLSIDEYELAHDLNLSVAAWRELCAREITPLHGWEKVLCDNDEIRWAHPVVTEVALQALASKRDHEAKKLRRKITKRRSDLAEMLVRLGHSEAAASTGFLEAFDAWIDANHGDGQRREGVIRDLYGEYRQIYLTRGGRG